MLNNAAVRQEHSLGVSGGSDKTTYAFSSANYLGQKEMWLLLTLM
jgi:hypothetical protein